MPPGVQLVCVRQVGSLGAEGGEEGRGGMASPEEVLEWNVLGRALDAAAGDVPLALWAVPVSGWGVVQGRAA